MAFATTKVLRAAESRVRERIKHDVAPRRVDDGCRDLTDDASVRFAPLAQELAKSLGIDVGDLQLDTTLRKLFRVHRDELSPEVRALMPKLGLGDVVDPFAFDLLDFAERRFREVPGRAKHHAFTPAPQNEDEWVERILDLTARDFLNALT